MCSSWLAIQKGIHHRSIVRGVDIKQDEVIVIDDNVDDIEGNLDHGVCVKKDPVDHFSFGGVSQLDY